MALGTGQMKTSGAGVGNGRRVLIVDDDPSIRFLVREFLARMGCEVAEACNGREAMAMIPAVDPEAMILDLSMPELDGFGVLEAMRSQGCLDRIRVLVLSARSQRHEVGRAIELGARDYLTKPFEERSLVLRMARLLIRSPSELP